VALPDVADYPAVRAAIDLSLDDTTLPDDVIGLPIYAGAAEVEIGRRVANYADVITAGGANAALLTNAAIWICAALLVPAVPNLTGERTPDSQQYSRQAFDPAAKVAQLRALADQAIGEVLGEDPLTAARPVTFAVACGRRGR